VSVDVENNYLHFILHYLEHFSLSLFCARRLIKFILKIRLEMYKKDKALQSLTESAMQAAAMERFLISNRIIHI
jgi:hypothetical protein